MHVCETSQTKGQCSPDASSERGKTDRPSNGHAFVHAKCRTHSKHHTLGITKAAQLVVAQVLVIQKTHPRIYMHSTMQQLQPAASISITGKHTNHPPQSAPTSAQHSLPCVPASHATAGHKCLQHPTLSLRACYNATPHNPLRPKQATRVTFMSRL